MDISAIIALLFIVGFLIFMKFDSLKSSGKIKSIDWVDVISYLIIIGKILFYLGVVFIFIAAFVRAIRYLF